MSQYSLKTVIKHFSGILTGILLSVSSELTLIKTSFAESNDVSSNLEKVYSVNASPDEKNYPSKIVKKLFLSSVKIIGPVEGSGVLISKTGNIYTVLTAWHVLKDFSHGEEIEILTSDMKKHNMINSSKHRIGASDMATIKFRSPLDYQIAHQSEPKFVRGMKIFVAGYAQNVQDYIDIEHGRIVQSTIDYINSGKPNLFLDQGYQLIYTNETLAGMSGGGIFSVDGNLIGIHGRGELERRITVRENKIVKSGINYGMPLNLYTNPDLALASRLDRINIVDPEGFKLSNALDISLSMINGEEQLLLAFVDEILALKTTFPALYLKSVIMMRLGDGLQMLSTINAAFKLPNLTEQEEKLALSIRSAAYSNLGNYKLGLENAKQEFKIADDVDDEISALLSMAGNLTNLGDLDEAATIYSRLESFLLDDSISARSRYNILLRLANNATNSNDYLLASKFYESALATELSEKKIDNKNSVKSYLAYYIYPKIDRTDDGLTILNELISSDPFDINARSDRAALNMSIGDFASAQADIDVVLELRPADSGALMDQAILFLHKRDLKKACYYRALSRQEMDGSYHFYEGSPFETECAKSNDKE